jgi:hypothetical protein
MVATMTTNTIIPFTNKDQLTCDGINTTRRLHSSKQKNAYEVIQINFQQRCLGNVLCGILAPPSWTTHYRKHLTAGG